MGFVARLCQPSTLRMLIWPEASSAQNNMAAISADGSTVCVLILRLNSSCSRSIAFVVRTLRHWLCGGRVKVKSLCLSDREARPPSRGRQTLAHVGLGAGLKPKARRVNRHLHLREKGGAG
jgi:hypothetical protein